MDTDIGKTANHTAQNKCDEMLWGKKLLHTDHRVGDGFFTIPVPLREGIEAA